MPQKKENMKKDHSKIKRSGMNKRIVLVSSLPLKKIIKEKWYFDNGYSKHMTGNNCFLTDL